MYEIHVQVSRLTAEMHEGIIVCHSPSTGQSVDPLKCPLACSEHIEGQWFLSKGKSEDTCLNITISMYLHKLNGFVNKYVCVCLCVCMCVLCVSMHVCKV